MMASPTWQHTWQSWRTFLLNIVQRLSKFRTTTAHKIMSFSSLEALALRWQFDRFDPCPAVHLPKKPRGSEACVKTSNLLEFRYFVLGVDFISLRFSFAGCCRDCHSSAANDDGCDILRYRSRTLDRRAYFHFHVKFL